MMFDAVIVLVAAPVLAVTSWCVWVAIDEVRKWRMRRAFRADNGRAIAPEDPHENGSTPPPGEQT